VKRGGKKLFEELSAGGGTTVTTLPAGAGRALWLMVSVNNGGDQYTLSIVEEAAMKQEVEFTAEDLGRSPDLQVTKSVIPLYLASGRGSVW
jgi:hypothetical protein